MCNCFTPTYGDYDFGFGLGVLGDEMSEVENVAFKLFSGSDLYRFGLEHELEGYLTLLDLQFNRMEAEMLRAKEEPFNEILQFEISWSPAKDFQDGYLAGRKIMLEGLDALRQLLRSEQSDTSDCFSEIILPWAEKWQETHRNFYFYKTPALAEVRLSDIDQLRILSSSMAWITIDGEPWGSESWLGISVRGHSPAQALVSALWSSPQNWGQGIAFTLGPKYSGPQDLDDRQTREFDFLNLCDEHWSEISAYNSKLLKEAGLTPSLD